MSTNVPIAQQSKLWRKLPLSAFTKSFRPLGDRVALKRDPRDSLARPGSSILRPESSQKNSDRATVLATGPRCRLGLRAGDRVVISRFADGDRVWGGESLLIIPEGEILALEEGSPPSPRFAK